MAKNVMDAAKSSMGSDINEVDLINIKRFAERVVQLADYRMNLRKYLVDKMNVVAPNLSALIGETIGARLISHAGSLTNLAKYPASTVQILGAEKALFRALKTKGNTPKYGLIYHSTFIGRAGNKHKGRISRFLANKCSIACRIDCFSDVPTNKYGEALRQQVEERLAFYESGTAVSKNADAIKKAQEAIAADLAADDDEEEDDDEAKEHEVAEAVKLVEAGKKEAAENSGPLDPELAKIANMLPGVVATPEGGKKKDKKDKKRKSDAAPLIADVSAVAEGETPSKKSKKDKSKKAKTAEGAVAMDVDEPESTPKKEKKEKKDKEGKEKKKKRKSEGVAA